MTSSEDRKRGALLGLAVGDALGTTLEFGHPSPPPFPLLATAPLTTIVGGGPFGVAAGEVTDDTQMAVALFTVLTKNASPSATDLASAYVAWSKSAFDIGNQTSDALAGVLRGLAPTAAGRSAWHEVRAGNGSLMRTTPIAVFTTDPTSRRALSLLDSAITHFDPRCRLACAAHNACIAAAIAGASATDLVEIAADEIAACTVAIADEYDGPLAESAAGDLRDDLDAAEGEDPRLVGAMDMYAHAGFVRVAFRLAFWELLHRRSFSEAVLDAANRGGDADTNAAITGALYGSTVGVDAIPDEWRTKVLTCVPAHPVSARYHPSAFLGA